MKIIYKTVRSCLRFARFFVSVQTMEYLSNELEEKHFLYLTFIDLSLDFLLVKKRHLELDAKKILV
jgi:hypothetical protein